MKRGDKIKVIASIPKAGQVNNIDHLIGQIFTILRVNHDDGSVSVEVPSMGYIVLNKKEFELTR